MRLDSLPGGNLVLCILGGKRVLHQIAIVQQL